MIALLAGLALLQQGAGVPASVSVREGTRVERIPVVVTRLGAMVRADEILRPLRAALLRDTPERFRLVITGAEFEFTTGVPIARLRGVAQQLASAPAALEGSLYLPLSLLTDVVPRTLAGFEYDAGKAELVRHVPSEHASLTAATARPDTAARAAAATPRGADAPSPTRPPPTETPREANARTRRPVVVVDAGHGGRDRGMRGPLGRAPSLYEADITLAVSRRLRDELTHRGVHVVMTRDADTLVALADRGRIANRAQAELFLSIHVNAANPRWRNPAAARGFETYFLSDAKTDDERRVAELENEAVKYEVEAEAEGGDDLSFILNDMKQNEYLRESSELARTVQDALRPVHPGTDRGVKQAGFVVLNGAFMPSALIEIGFGSNPAEAAYLASASGQQAIARAIAEAVVAYLERYASRRATGDAR